MIAGPRVAEAQVIGNRIEGAQNGVRIAASSRSDPVLPDWQGAEPPNVVERATVERNVVALNPPAPGLPAHGVYLGHVRAADVTGNDVTGPAGSVRDTLWYGIRSYGYRGRLLAVTRNAAANLGVGVSVMPDLEPDGAWPGARWYVSGNGTLNVADEAELARGVIEWP